MTEPVIAKKEPAILDLEQGTYYWCKCGKSETQPFCDASHEGTEFLPEEFKIEKKEKVALCQCKRTVKAPFCDGTHNELSKKSIWPRF
jgi:CDGSH-type Zn-finger protein